MEDIIAEIKARKTEPLPEGNQHVIALDGKALRGSRAAKHKKMVYILSAYCSELKLVIRQVLEKFNGWSIPEEKLSQQCAEESIGGY